MYYQDAFAIHHRDTAVQELQRDIDGFHYLLVLATMPESRTGLSLAQDNSVQQIRNRHTMEEASPAEEDLHFFRTYAARYGLAGQEIREPGKGRNW